MILCGTDLSVASSPAVQVAAALAHKLGRDLLLVNVQEGLAERGAPVDVELEREAAEVRRTFGVSVETSVVRGVPEQQLLELALRREVSLVVVGARGSSRHSRRLGSVPEYLCQRAEMPVLVARQPDRLLPWSNGRKPLNVLLGSGLGDASRSALELVSGWPELSLTIAHVAWPFGEHYRLGVSGPMPLEHLRPEVHHQLLGDLGRWTAGTPSAGSAKLIVTPGFGRIDCHLAQIAEERSADLLVVGTHQRNLTARIWQGSISRSAIHEANCSVLCVPQALLPPRTAPAPRTLVIPTDFSALADRALAHGYSLLPTGGTAHLVHVVPALSDANRAELSSKLAARVPKDAAARGVRSELVLLEGSEAWLAIWQYAGRASADLICMATHSRDTVKSLVLGSQAQALLQHSRVPVLLVPPDRES